MKKAGSTWARIALGLSLVVILAALTGCRKKGAAEDDITQLIIEHKGFPRPIYFSLEVGKLDQIKLGAFGTWDDYVKAWTTLDSLGYIELKQLGTTTSGDWLNIPKKNVEIALTDKGNGTFKLEDDNIFRTVMCEQVLREVQGIVLNDDETEAEVDFSWTYANFAPFFGAVLPISDLRDVDVDSPRHEKIILKRTKEGWRVAEERQEEEHPPL
jgi:hypothetical protein